jgi:hypothetical protein
MGPARLPVLALSLLYRLVRRVIEMVRIHWMHAVAKEAEIRVLRRHHLAVVRRQVARPASPGRIERL